MQEVLRSEGPRQKQRLGRIRALVAALVSHFPLTTQGSLALILSAGALRLFGYGSMDLVVFALCLCALFVVITSLFATVIGGLIVQRRILRTLENQTTFPSGDACFEAGYLNSTGFSLDAVSWLPLVRIAWRIVSPTSIETLNERRRDNRLHETIIPARRGKSASITRRFEVRDALGLCSYSWLATQPLAHKPSLASAPIKHSPSNARALWRMACPKPVVALRAIAWRSAPIHRGTRCAT